VPRKRERIRPDYEVGYFIGESTLVENDKGLVAKQRRLAIGVVIGLISVIMILFVVVTNLPSPNTTKEPVRVIVITPTP
jgi:hypothetical protein